MSKVGKQQFTTSTSTPKAMIDVLRRKQNMSRKASLEPSFNDLGGLLAMAVDLHRGIPLDQLISRIIRNTPLSISRSFCPDIHRLPSFTDLLSEPFGRFLALSRTYVPALLAGRGEEATIKVTGTTTTATPMPGAINVPDRLALAQWTEPVPYTLDMIRAILNRLYLSVATRTFPIDILMEVDVFQCPVTSLAQSHGISGICRSWIGLFPRESLLLAPLARVLLGTCERWMAVHLVPCA